MVKVGRLPACVMEVLCSTLSWDTSNSHSRIFVVSFCPARHIPGYYIENVMISSFHILFNSLFTTVQSFYTVWSEFLTASSKEPQMQDLEVKGRYLLF
jgi:hypothetical protein